MTPLFDERRYLIPFRTTLLPQIFTDILVIGGGVAGLRAALSAAEQGEVIVTAKGHLGQSSSDWAQGGISAVLDRDEGESREANIDSFESHITDTIRAGSGLCDQPMVRDVVYAAPMRMAELVGWGMQFDREGNDFARGREGGHSFPRILHADGDATGRALMATLGGQVHINDRIRLFEDCCVIDLITVEGPEPSGSQCVGAITHHPKFGLQVIWAVATILCSGGAGQIYRESTNPHSATGDGLAIAYRAGATLGNMAFMQFQPTTLYVAGAARWLITEAVRGEGGVLIDRNGDRFMPDYHEMADLAPRDVVSRSIFQQMVKTGFTHVFLDCRPIGGEKFSKRFPGISQLLNKFDLNPSVDPVPVHPSAHYMIGGIRTDASGRTSVRGLYAAGEVASTGLHGANRLASNSLLEGLVCGAIAGNTCREMLESPHNERGPFKVACDIRTSQRAELDLADVRSSLRSVMWRHVGIERTGAQLTEVAEMFNFWARYTLDKVFNNPDGWQVQNMLTVGALLTQAAEWRQESRGVHYRTDYPQTNEKLRLQDIWLRGQSEPTLIPVADIETSSSDR